MLNVTKANYVVDFCVGSLSLVVFLSFIHLVGAEVAQDRARYFENFVDFHDAKSIPLVSLFPDNFFRYFLYILIPDSVGAYFFGFFWSSMGYIFVLLPICYFGVQLRRLGYVYSHFLLIMFVITDRLVMDAVLNTTMSSISVSFASLGLFLAAWGRRSVYVPNKFVLVGCAAHFLAAMLLYFGYVLASCMPKKRLVMVVCFICLIAFLSWFDFSVLIELSTRVNQAERKALTVSQFIQVLLISGPFLLVVCNFVSSRSYRRLNQWLLNVLVVGLALFCVTLFVPQALRFSILFIFFFLLIKSLFAKSALVFIKSIAIVFSFY